MAIDKRKNKDGSCSYRVRIFIEGKLTQTKSFNKKVDAVNWEASQKHNINMQANFPDKIRTCSVEELYHKWLREHATNHKAASSVVRDKQIFKDYLKKNIGNKKAHLVTSEEIEKIKQKLIEEDRLTNKSINNILQVIKTIFNFGIKRKCLKFNPLSCVSMLPVDQEAFDYWSFDESIRFLKYASSKHKNDRAIYVLYLLCLKTGMRIGEAVALKWDCVDLGNKIITIKRSFDTARQNIQDTTKGRKIRHVGICNELLPELLSLFNKQDKSDFVLPNKNGGFIDYNNLRERHFEKDIHSAGVKKIRIHDMRHTYASTYLIKGGDIFSLNKTLGHSDIKTTMRYAHLAQGQKVEIANVINYGLNEANNIIEFGQTVHTLSTDDFFKNEEGLKTAVGFGSGARI